jgi:hypothetical protein
MLSCRQLKQTYSAIKNKLLFVIIKELIMFNSQFFKFRYLVMLILLVVLVAAIGNAATLSVASGGQNVVAGVSNNYANDTATITYSIDASGNVVADVVFTTDSFTDVSASFGGSYVSCTGAAQNWSCTLPHADIAGATNISLVATADN